MSPNPCPDREPMLQALLDGELDAANTVALEAHLKTCPGCFNPASQLRKTSPSFPDEESGSTR